MNTTTIEQVRAEEREALRRHREGQKLARAARTAAARREREARNARRTLARQQRQQLGPQLRKARRAYFASLADALKERQRDTAEDVSTRFDEADRRMDHYLALARQDARLARAARA